MNLCKCAQENAANASIGKKNNLKTHFQKLEYTELIIKAPLFYWKD